MTLDMRAFRAWPVILPEIRALPDDDAFHCQHAPSRRCALFLIPLTSWRPVDAPATIQAVKPSVFDDDVAVAKVPALLDDPAQLRSNQFPIVISHKESGAAAQAPEIERGQLFLGENPPFD